MPSGLLHHAALQVISSTSEEHTVSITITLRCSMLHQNIGNHLPGRLQHNSEDHNIDLYCLENIKTQRTRFVWTIIRRVSQKSLCTCHREWKYSDSHFTLIQIHLSYLLSHNKCCKMGPACLQTVIYTSYLGCNNTWQFNRKDVLLKFAMASFSSWIVRELSLWTAPFIAAPW